MAFYIKPPGGTEQLNKLHIFCKKRLRFLKQILSCDGCADFRELVELAETADDSECLIEGTHKDRLSHFLLRLACCQDPEMAAFFVRAETELFCYRFTCMNTAEVVHLLQSTHRFLQRLYRHQAKRKLPSGYGQRRSRTGCDDLFQILHRIQADGQTWSDIIGQYQDGCRSEFIQVPFEYALSLVSHRSVVLDRGIASVPSADILKVFAFLFEQVISDGMVDAGRSLQDIASNDERMIELFRSIRQMYYMCNRSPGTRWAPGASMVTADEIDSLSAYFPPCMQHLHRMLRKKHRLRHFSRIQYTLFLKEVGLPVADAVKFWQTEYSKPHRCQGDGTGCTHDWTRDGRRYTYSIRHLYGLEGSKVNYRAHCCHSLQSCSIGHGEEGGCPFQHFDDLHLRQTMDQAGITSETDQTQVINLAAQGKKQAACKAFFKKSTAVAVGRILRAATPKGNTCSQDKKEDDKTSDEETDSNFQPCNKKKLRLNVNCRGDGSAAETSFGRGLMQDDVKKGSVLTKQLDPEGVVRAPSHDPTQVLNQSTNSEDVDCTKRLLFSTIVDSAKPEVNSLDKNGLFKEVLVPTGGSSGSISQPKSALNETSSSSSDTRDLMARTEHMPVHETEHSSLASTDLGNLDDNHAHCTQLVTALTDVQIQKPLDFYRSYIDLLESLNELEDETIH